MPAGPSGKSYEKYDPKYNLYEDISDYESVPAGTEVAATTSVARKNLCLTFCRFLQTTMLIPCSQLPDRTVNYPPAASSTILVIGIVLVVIIAVILIIIIVLKVRTSEEVNYKVDESKIVHTEETPASVNNGFQPKPCKTTNNNSSSVGTSKPVKEWYV